MKALLLVCLALAGCSSSGIQMTDEQAEDCKQQGCSTHTLQELQQGSQRIYIEGFKAGRRYEKGST